MGEKKRGPPNVVEIQLFFKMHELQLKHGLREGLGTYQDSV